MGRPMAEGKVTGGRKMVRVVTVKYHGSVQVTSLENVT